MTGLLRRLLLALLALLAGLPSTARAGTCLQDGDCPGVQICMAGRCSRADCNSDAQCPDGRMCRNGVCRLRECRRDEDCNIERRCLDGICGMPLPDARVAPPTPREPVSQGVELTVGPLFPSGMVAEIGLQIGDDRWLTLAAGTTLDAGGVGWRVGWRQAVAAVGLGWLDVFATLTGLRVGPAQGSGWAGMLLGSGRGLFDAARTVSPVFWGGGLGCSLPHGRDRRRVLRLELGALLLLHDRYPADQDLALLPLVGLRYGVSF